MVGPNYHKPAAIVPPAYKEAPGWTQWPRHADAIPKGAWWTIYDDCRSGPAGAAGCGFEPDSGGGLRAYEQSLEIVAEVQGGLFPTVGLTSNITRAGAGGGSGSDRQ